MFLACRLQEEPGIGEEPDTTMGGMLGRDAGLAAAEKIRLAASEMKLGLNGAGSEAATQANEAAIHIQQGLIGAGSEAAIHIQQGLIGAGSEAATQANEAATHIQQGLIGAGSEAATQANEAATHIQQGLIGAGSEAAAHLIDAGRGAATQIKYAVMWASGAAVAVSIINALSHRSRSRKGT